MDGGTSEIDGAIIAIRETWPLQLVVEAPGGRHDVALSEDTALTRAGTPVGSGALEVGAVVRVVGRLSAPHAMVASRVDILS
ncbi:hypothetical protein [Geodermatophilus sabuli]|uniref:DUF5666 domain-containing protein n=1 Tax=Geodermatophilus sabuli TaxID=1564158 RepID=A0A285E9A1_9ACTN|nr:hypothetical protein [Geodermatophilus sabuli]MBB3082464.1 hypothetical protein [Geodermatophilus sabuli]SNX94666.1 hypothetical protein SAMN06893097_101463 [Geodermatophilus sabuli]